MKLMELAFEEAVKAFNQNEIPVGCVITLNGNVIARAHNTTIAECNNTKHAEINAINQALEFVNQKELKDCEMYVTLEPCPMCAGAIINTKIKRLYIGAQEPKSGCFGSKTDFSTLKFNHSPEVYHGICEDKCKKIMVDFFENKR